MRRPPILPFHLRAFRSSGYKTKGGQEPIVRIHEGTFYREYPSAPGQDAASNPAIFPKLTFSLQSHAKDPQYWAIVGPSNAGKTTFFQILRGQHICFPSTARSFPYLASEAVSPRHRNPARAIQYVGFDGERGGVGKSGTRGAYLSARYESRREATDFTVMDYLRGDTDLNPLEEPEDKKTDRESLGKVINDLRLEALVDMPMGNLSNGQTRRARIARALLGDPLALLLDEPFMGLDPPTIKALNPLLHNLARMSSPRLVLALRPQDPLPDWITHLIYLGPHLKIAQQGTRQEVFTGIQGRKEEVQVLSAALAELPSSGYHHSRFLPQRGIPQFFRSIGTESVATPLQRRQNFIQERMTSRSREGLPLKDSKMSTQQGEALVEMRDVCVKYGDKPALGGWYQEIDGQTREGLWWTVRRGERWGVFGPNGSGKTTLLSLICSDHPQSYSLPIKVFGRARLPRPGQPGISIFDIQARIGQSSPEIHAFFPRNLSIRQTIENAWADTYLGTPRLSYENDIAVDACLRWFEAELNPAFNSELGIFSQKNLDEKVQGPRSTDWADDIRFGDAPFSAQRVALLLRAIVKKPDLVVLDEAFSGMDEYVRDKCMLFLTWGETRSFAFFKHDQARPRRRWVMNTHPKLLSSDVFEGLSDYQALICVSHVKEEVPGLVSVWISLPEASSRRPARFGRFNGPLEADTSAWDEIWNV